MSMKVETIQTRFWLKWGAVTSLLLFFLIGGASLAVGMIFVMFSLSVEYAVDSSALWLWLIVLPVILVGGSFLLGWVQSNMLRHYLPELKGWVAVTVLGMIFFIGFNLLFLESLLGSSEIVDSLNTWLGVSSVGFGRDQYSEVRNFMSTAVSVFRLTLTAFGFMSFWQWLRLHRYVKSAYWWFGGTLLSVFSGNLIGMMIGRAIGAIVTVVCIVFFQGMVLEGLLKRQNQLNEPWFWDRYIIFTSLALGSLALLVLILLSTRFVGQPGARLFSSGCEQSVMADLTYGRSGISQLLSGRTPGHKNTISKVMMIPNGQELLTMAQDGSVRLWEWPCLQEKLVIPIDQYVTYAPIDVTADSRYLVTMNPFSRPIVVEVMTGETVLKMDYAISRSLAVAPNGEYVALPNKSTISVRHLSDGGEQCQFTAHAEGPITHVLFTPDSQRVLSVDFYDGLRVWDPATCSQSLAIPRPYYALEKVVIDPTGQYVAAVTNDQSHLFVWNLTRGDTLFERERISEGFWRGDILFSADGRYLIAAGGNDSLRIWEWQENVERYHYKLNGLAHMTMSPDGSQLIAFTRDGEMTILNWEELVP